MSTRKSYISRSVYQKLSEENKRLLKDIRVLYENNTDESEFWEVWNKWNKKFGEEKIFNAILKEIAKQELLKIRGKKPLKN